MITIFPLKKYVRDSGKEMGTVVDINKHLLVVSQSCINKNGFLSGHFSPKTADCISITFSH